MLSGQVNPHQLNIKKGYEEDIYEFSSSDDKIGLITYAGLGWIKIYQTLVSSQDSPACNFNPSCSHFGFEAIQKDGLFRGVLLTADRLMRCNPFVGNGHYQLDGDKYSDPIVDYRY